MILSQPSTSDEEGAVAPGDAALGRSGCYRLGKDALATAPYSHDVLGCWKPEGPVDGLTFVQVLQP